MMRRGLSSLANHSDVIGGGKSAFLPPGSPARLIRVMAADSRITSREDHEVSGQPFCEDGTSWSPIRGKVCTGKKPNQPNVRNTFRQQQRTDNNKPQKKMTKSLA